MSLIPAFEIGVWNAWILMIWLLILNLAIMLGNKEVYQRMGNPPDMKLSCANRIAGYISTPLWLLSTTYSIFLPLKLGMMWFYAGLVLFVAGLVISIIVAINFATTPIDEPIAKGIYRYSRHPGYVGMFLIYLGVGIASASWVFLLVSVVLLILISFAVIDEERYCLGKYGETYREYMNRTPRWIGIPQIVKSK